MTARTREIFAIGLAAVAVIAGCAQPLSGSSPTPAMKTSPEAANTWSQGGVTARELRVSITGAGYGTLAALTAGGAICDAVLGVGAGFYGEQPPGTLPQRTANAAGAVRWEYAAPRVPRNTATYAVTCRDGASVATASGSFDIATAPILATAVAVHVTVDTPPHVTIDGDPSLVPLRDSAVAKMKETLSTEWRSATRGLGGLRLVEGSADITLYVVAAKGTSVHRAAQDGSEDIVVHVSDKFGPQAVENVVATALHELGHIWCCYGPGTYPPGSEKQGHWLVDERSPGLYGVDKYGLMTDPVTCVRFGAALSCPNRFSDREMTALGFVTFPPPAADPCITQALSLKSDLATIDGQLATLKAQIGTQEATLSSLESQIRSIEQQYPNGGAAASVVERYNSLVSQYNLLLAQNTLTVSAHNALVERSRTQASQLNSLPCDAS